MNFKSPHSGLLGRLDSGREANTGALLPMTPIQNKTSERIYNAVLFCLAVISLSIITLSPLRSSAQSSDNSAQPTLPDDRARLDQAAPPGDAALADRENALRLAEDDLLKRLGSSLPKSGEVPAEPPIDPTQSVVVVQPHRRQSSRILNIRSRAVHLASCPLARLNLSSFSRPPESRPQSPRVQCSQSASTSLAHLRRRSPRMRRKICPLPQLSRPTHL